MILSGLTHLDFSGIGSMGSVTPVGIDEAVSVGLQNVPPIYSAVVDAKLLRDKFTTLIQAGYKAVKSSEAIQPADDMAVANAAIPGSDGGVFIDLNPTKRSALVGVLQSLRRNGYYIVSSDFVSSGPTQAPKSELVDPNNIAAAGAIAVAQQGSARSGVTSTPAPRGSISDTISSGIKSIISAWPKSPATLPTQYIRASHVQTAAEKQRLTLIIGGFGIMFVLAMGVIAARSND